MITKYLIFVAVGVAIGIGSTLGITKAVKPQMNLVCNPAPCECNCPPTLGSEFDKIKSKYVTLNLNQTYKTTMNGDSLFIATLVKEIEALNLKLKISRCK